MRIKCKYFVFVGSVALLIIGSGCSKTGTIPDQALTVSINPKESVDALLNEVCDSVFYISLQIPDSLIWGDVFYAKSYGPYIFIPDDSRSSTISVFDTQGNFVSQLDKKGKGPGEYKDMECFTYSSETNELIIHDRVKGYFFYKLPDLGFSRHIFENQNYKISIESIGKNLITCGEEPQNGKKGDYRGIEFFNVEEQKYYSRNLAKLTASAEISYGNVFSQYKNGTVLYAHPYYFTTIYQLTEKENIPLCTIDFGDFSIPEDVWATDKALDFEEELNKGKATWVQDLIWKEDRFMFEYLFKDRDTRHLVSHHWSTGKTNIYSSLRFWKEGPVLPAPLGVYKDFFMSLIYPEDLSEYTVDQTNIGEGSALFQQIRRSDHPVLVMYRLK